MKNQGVIRIDRAAFLANYRTIQAQFYGKCEAAAALKADAYGLGMAALAPLIHKDGCHSFFVATLDEGIALRTILPTAAIYVLEGVCPEHFNEYARHALKPVLNSLDDIVQVKKETPASVAYALHFDTGMNRLGLGAAETKKLLGDLSLLENVNINLVMSHFACADEADHPLTQKQHELFKTIAAHFPNARKSLSNSSGIFRGQNYHFDMARPGIALYGLNPTPEKPNPMRAVVSMEAPVLQVRKADKNETIGYGARHRLEEDSVLATIGIGYADGFPRSLSGRGKLYWQGAACPILGRVSMDLTVVDITHIPESRRPAPGDVLEVLGPHQNADSLAADAGTIGYEILTSLGRRFRRIYVD